ncbi:hypothetical protein M5D96_005019 [Drosophila gunungcola]|uniref:C-type lectin domain-containing protein n=1 Tax=Drosophila gunungcola TaxID=103775 RepID=A0A9Q0BTK8_9MUSC|nr:hypothetical protein M5D96_005019 [Drosophila gunungcola]
MILEHMVVMNERIKKLESYTSEFENFKKELSDLKVNQNSNNENLKIQLENRSTEVLSENTKVKEMIYSLQTDFTLQKENLKSLAERTIERYESLDKKITDEQANKSAEINKLSMRFDGVDTQFAGQKENIDIIQKEMNEKLNKNDGLHYLEDVTTKQVNVETAIQKINAKIRNLAFKKIGSKAYYIEETQERNWNDSRAFCLDLGGHLFSPQSQLELDTLGKELKKELYWTDIQDFSKEGEFISDTTGRKPKFLSWRQNPDDWNGEDCVEIGLSRSWGMNDNGCSTLLNFVCERQIL